MVRKLHDFDWMATPDCQEALRVALKRLPARTPLVEIYAVLHDAKFWQREDERARTVRGKSRQWIAERTRVLRDLDALERRILRVYDAADGRRRFALTVLGTDGARRGQLIDPGLLGGKARVLGAIDTLRRAITDDPLWSARLGQGRRGPPARPWLHWGFAELRKRGVTRDAADELLRWTGLKPPE